MPRIAFSRCGGMGDPLQSQYTAVPGGRQGAPTGLKSRREPPQGFARARAAGPIDQTIVPKKLPFYAVSCPFPPCYFSISAVYYITYIVIFAQRSEGVKKNV